MKKISSLFLILILIFQGLASPVHALTNMNQVEVKQGIVTTDSDSQAEGVPLYIDSTVSSDLVMRLYNGDHVNILEELNDFSHVTLLNGDSSENIQGFIENKYLSISNDESTVKDEQDTIGKDDEDKEVVVTDESADDNNENEQILESENANESSEADENEELADIDESADNNNIKVEESDSEPVTEESDINNEKPSSDNSQKDVEVQQVQLFSTASTEQEITVVGLRNPTNIRAKDSTRSEVIGSYPQGTIINVKPYSKNWYEHTTNDGNRGYIHHKHVDNIVDNPESFSGIGIKNPTNIRELASTRSKIVQSRQIGSIIRLKTFSSDWYEALDENKVIGYIHHKHIGDTVNTNQNSFKGIGINSPTNIRTLPSTKSKVLDRRPVGDIIDLRTFSDHWYQATTKDGKIGYVHRNHVGDTILTKQDSFQGIGVNSPTILRQLPSTKAKVAERRPIGDIINLKTFSQHWYQATTKNGKIGYVHKNHIGDTVLTKKESFRGIGINNPTIVRVLPSTKANVAERAPVGDILNLETFSRHWYKATTSRGKKGYVHRNHIGDTVLTKRDFFYGEALRSQTIVRALPSTQAKVAQRNKKGHTFRLQSFSKHWHEVIDLNNKRIGFVHKNHVKEKDNITQNYSVSLKNAVDMQMKATPQTDKKYAWVSKQYIKNNRVTASSLHVRVGPGTNHSSMGTLLNGTTVKVLDEHNGWYAIEYTSGGQWRHAGPKDVTYYLNPLNFVNDARQQFQFLDLSRSSSASATEINKVLNNNGVLHGKGSYFIEAGNKYRINDIYLVSHAKLETGNGKSELATGISRWTQRDRQGNIVRDANGDPIIVDISPRKVYNMYGIGAFDRCARDCGAQRAYDNGWFSVETAIVEGAAFIGDGYVNAGQNTLYKMRWNPAAMEKGNVTHQYATDIGWAFKQTYTISELYKQLGSYTLHLDIPVYK